MVTYFFGGAIDSATTGLAYGAGGWSAVIVLGACYSVACLALWAISLAVPGLRSVRATGLHQAGSAT
jgi:hypothetical protein